MRSAAILALLAQSILTPLNGQQQASAPAPSESHLEGATVPTGLILPAVRVQGEAPVIDGLLSDEVWTSAPVATDFTQLEPNEGAIPTERTEVRVLYGADALFVAFRAYDSAPDSIAGQLTRRDTESYSDAVHVLIDSYFDKRTAFHFGVNPVGVKLDIYRFDDTQEDASWDAVWDVATRIDSEGWTAEFRIPYSQLRFGNHDDQLDPGVNGFPDRPRGVPGGDEDDRGIGACFLPRLADRVIDRNAVNFLPPFPGVTPETTFVP